MLQRASSRGAASPLRQLGENDGGEEGREMNQEKAGMGEGGEGGELDGEYRVRRQMNHSIPTKINIYV